MERKELKINIPDGYEIDKENSTFECIKFKSKPKRLTYEDVAKELFFNKDCFDVNDVDVCHKNGAFIYFDFTATSQQQLQKLIAINKLMNVAKYLNGDWKPDWDTAKEDKVYCFINYFEDKTFIGYNSIRCEGHIYFKTKELVQQAIDILGEDTIRLALSTDW